MIILCGISFSAAYDAPRGWRKNASAAIALILAVGFLAAPIAIRHKFPELVQPVFASVIVLSAALGIAGIAMLRERMRLAYLASALSFPAFLLIASMGLSSHIDNGLTDADLPRLIEQSAYAGDSIVASKI